MKHIKYFTESDLDAVQEASAPCVVFVKGQDECVFCSKLLGNNIVISKDEDNNIICSAVESEIINDDYVDLGLPSGLLWASCNVGASTPSDYGDFYAWGETSTKENYYDNTYTFGTASDITKYNETDGKIVLESDDDVVYQKTSGEAHMPTKEDFEELDNNTDSIWCACSNTDGEIHYGRMFVSRKDSTKRIFIPASGLQVATDISYRESYSYVWTSSIGSEGSAFAWMMDSCVDDVYFDNVNRCFGFNVRGVKSSN